ncbi:MAG: hypothetical protein A2V70_04940 [Planctomycetes bacterium RBG_13_63_9]|nr:MAG: hypothetical protein A2V70_04940 [Planctomycetes bacterium RBG_13_63_9]
MREAEVRIEFQPSGQTVFTLQGTRLLEAAASAGIVVDQPCGGEGLCGKCRVKVLAGACPPTPAECQTLAPEEIEAGWRLACQTCLCQEATVLVPETSLLDARSKILTDLPDRSPVADDPPIHKRYVELPPPSRDDDAADLTRLKNAVGPLRADLEVLRVLPRRLRLASFRGTVVLADSTEMDCPRLIDFEPGNTEAETFAVAVDLGTTTLVAALLDLNTAGELAVVSRLNPQTRFGDDVLSRILHVRQTPGGLRQLQQTIATAVDEMIGELAHRQQIPRERIYDLTFSGNTTMQQLLSGIDPSSLGEVPFVPAVASGLVLPAAELGLHVHPHAHVYVLPVIGGFVGGDTVSGIMATALAEADGPSLLVDIGTNGEIVLLADGKLRAASTAAGPAFEGARISHGMRGSTGAIEKVTVDGRLRINVIGDVPPVGLCGSGLIDLAAELLRHRALTPQGHLNSPEQLPGDLLPDLAGRVTEHDGKPAFLLAPETETATGKPIVLTQQDVRELQLATGAIRAGITILLRRAGVEPAELQTVLIGGGFGNFIRRSNAQRIGLLPSAVPHHRIRYQGNTSLAGARLTALSQKARSMAEQLARRTEHVDLSSDPYFHTAFADAMIFPAADD